MSGAHTPCLAMHVLLLLCPGKGRLPALLPAALLVQIRQHTSQESCWFVRDGRVYDATSFLSKHPGGAAAILGQAGKLGGRIWELGRGDCQRACFGGGTAKRMLAAAILVPS